MENKGLKIKIVLQVLKPASKVFEAIIDPGKMSDYFISESSGKMIDGQLGWLG